MSPLCFPFIIVPLILIRVPASLGANIAQFTSCSMTIQCGNLENIGYPFWGVNRADYCGLSSEFQLTCVDNTSLQISISGLSYRVLRVDNSSRLFTVARADYNNSICPQYLYNSSQVIAPFTYSSDTVTSNLTLYYGCDPPSAAISPVLSTNQFSNFTCTVNSTATLSYFLTRSPADVRVAGISSITAITSYFEGCKTSVVVPANQSALQTIEDSPRVANVEAALDGGFGLQWADDDGECQSCIRSGGQCGRNRQDSSKFACYCSDKSYSSTCGGGNHRIPVLAIIGVVAGLIGIIAVLILVTICRHKSWRSLLKIMICSHENGENDADIETFITAHGSLAPKRYRYWDVKKMTNSFSEKLGTGGYGVVYKGKLGDGHHVAVKVLTESKGNVEDFLNEVASISRTAHVNVITLLGFCYERKRRALIYEYMPNGSLDKFIQTKEASDMSSPFLELKILYQIALGIARGLEYLHQGCNTRILHFDIKPQNILLDENFIPKISDFGLAKLCKKRESIVSMLGTRGTVGYIAPEVFSRNFGAVSHKSDVYSYGMLVLDMVGGRNKSGVQVSNTSESYFPDLIYKHLEEGGGIQLPGTTMEEEEEIVRKMVLVGLWCVQTHPSNRLSMKKVIEMLEGRVQVLEIPPKPRLSSPRRSPKNSSFTSSDFTSSILNEEMNPELQEKRGQRNSGQL